MKAVKVSFLAILVSSLFMASCTKENTCIQGQGGITSRTLSVANFTGLDLAGASNITISQGPTQEVIATGQSNILSLVSTEVSNNYWSVKLIDGCYQNYDLSFQITVPDINKIDLSGSGNIVVNNFVDQSDLEMNISGSGNITLKTFDGAENLSVDISGSGSILGNADFSNLTNLDIDISGSGNYNGFPIQTDDCQINIPGSGNCNVFVNDNLNVKISGSGSVFYKGNPTITTNISGSGSVINAN